MSVQTNPDNLLDDLFERVREEGQPHDGFGDLGKLACVFHLDYALFDNLIHPGETVALLEELHDTVFPFDVFEISLNEAPEMPFADDGPMAGYRPLRYLIAMRYEIGRTSFLIADDLEMREKSGRVRSMISAFSYSIISAQDPKSDGALQPQAIRPKGVRSFDAQKIVQEEHQNAYWLRLLMTAIRFARLLNHRGVTIQRFSDPNRPPTRQQRRAAGYVDQDHYRIVLRPRLNAETAITDVLSGRSLRYTPRRRHMVQEFVRTYASGRIGPVRAHMRGGGLSPEVDYDARAAIRAAIDDVRGNDVNI